MGEEVAQHEFTREDRTRYREKVRSCLDVLERMLRETKFDAEFPMTGLEIELNLVAADESPALRNLEAIGGAIAHRRGAAGRSRRLASRPTDAE